MIKGFFEKLVNRSTLSLIIIFFAFDVLGTLFYYLQMNDILESRFFRLGRDRSYFEVMEYLKTGVIIYIFHALWVKTKASLFKAWWILFIVMLVDNAVGVHEEVGEGLTLLAQHFGFEWEHFTDLAELLVMGMLEGTALLYVIYCYFQSEKQFQQFSRLLIGTVIMLGVVSILSEVFGLSRVEEATEILGFTVLLALIHHYYRRESVHIDESAGF